MYTSLSLSLCIYIYIHTYPRCKATGFRHAPRLMSSQTTIAACIHVCIYIYSVCMHYIYIYTSLSLYIYIYIYIERERETVTEGVATDTPAFDHDFQVVSPSYISRGIWRQGIGSFVRDSYVSTLCPVVICPYLCTSEWGLFRPSVSGPLFTIARKGPIWHAAAQTSPECRHGPTPQHRVSRKAQVMMKHGSRTTPTSTARS